MHERDREVGMVQAQPERSERQVWPQQSVAPKGQAAIQGRLEFDAERHKLMMKHREAVDFLASLCKT